MDKVILHCDLNNFYASVECMLHPELKNMPVAVCGDPKKRHGIVLAKNNIAKQAGIKTGDVIWQAKQKCPNLIVVPPTYAEYVKYSNLVFDIYTNYTDRVESFGIDECWLDVTESIALFGNGANIADEIRRVVKYETGLTISVGVSFTKVFAKLGSDLKKPDATTVISKDNFKKIVWPLDLRSMIMIGPKVKKQLNKLNIFTLGDLAHADRSLLKNHFGIISDKLIDNANGIENEEVKFCYDKHFPKSIGHGTTTAKDMKTFNEAVGVVYALSEMVATRLRKNNLLASTVAIGIRDINLHSITRQTTLLSPTSSASVIAENALILLKSNHNFSIPLRSLSVYTQKLSSGVDEVQLTLFDDKHNRENRLEECIDKIREKYGYKSVQRAILLNNKFLSDDLHDDDDFLPFKR